MAGQETVMNSRETTRGRRLTSALLEVTVASMCDGPEPPLRSSYVQVIEGEADRLALPLGAPA
eukprot:32546-Eustigmatos_ZCMA.PRE.1